METETEVAQPLCYRYPAKVLGCLRNGEITVIVCPGVGLADGGRITVLPVYIIPFNLRMPNSEFDVLFDRILGRFTKVLQKERQF